MKKQFTKKKVIFFIIIFLITPLQAFSKDKITIVYTNSLNGHLDDCHCKKNPKGGLIMRSTELKKIRSSFENVFLFETGDFYAPEYDEILANYVIKGYKYLNYDAILFGDQEFSGGADNFTKYKNELPFVCNNILLKSGKNWNNVFARYKILNKNKIKLGIIGTISNSAFKYYPKKILKQIKVIDQIKEINKDIKTLKNKGITTIVLLSHSGFEEDIELAKKIIGIDVIVGGHSQTHVKSPELINDTIIVQAGASGARLGILELSLKNDKVKMINNSFRLPHFKNTKEDEKFRKLITEYTKAVKKEYEKVRFK